MHGGTYTRRQILAAVGITGGGSLAGCSRLGGGTEPRIEVPDAALRDERVEIRLAGFEPETEVTVSAEIGEWRTDDVWLSRATFETDSDGAVDLTEQAPISGTYEETDGMGLVWSMRPRGEISTSTPAETDTATPSSMTSESTLRAYDVELRAAVDGEVRATGTTTRRLVAEGVTRESISTEEVVGELFVPGGEGPHPGALVLHGSGGDPSVSLSRALASHGYAAFALRYFDPEGSGDGPVPSELVEVPLPYFDRARSWLGDRDAVRDGSIGVVGASRGAEAALLVGGEYDWPAVVVAYSPSCYAWQGSSRDGSAAASAWSLDGEPVPYLEGETAATEVVDGEKYATTPVFESGMEAASAEERESAFVPVERIDAPLMLISGGDDRVWPAATFGRRIVDHLESAGVDFDYEHLTYENAGHAVTVPYRPTATEPLPSQLAMGGTPAADADAMADSWPRVLTTLEDALA